MKKIFVFLLVAGIFIKTPAQQPGSNADKNKFRNTIPQDSSNKLLEKATYSPSLFKQSNSYLLPDGDKVILLSQDNMPCVVPNMLMYNYNMPVYKGKIMGTIPNILPPGQIIPKKKKE